MSDEPELSAPTYRLENALVTTRLYTPPQVVECTGCEDTINGDVYVVDIGGREWHPYCFLTGQDDKIKWLTNLLATALRDAPMDCDDGADHNIAYLLLNKINTELVALEAAIAHLRELAAEEVEP